MGKRLNIEAMKQLFKERGCTLLEKVYSGSGIPMKYKCSCGNVSKISWDNLKQGKRCRKCGIQKIKEKQKTDINSIEKLFSDAGCELLETKYKKALQSLKYRCHCGNISQTNYIAFKKGNQKCPACNHKAQAYDIEQVREIFKKSGCELISTEYKNSRQKLRYKCSCGNVSKTYLSNFLKGVRCKQCAIKRITGLSNPSWNPNLTQKEREAKRHAPGNKGWSKKIFERDGYTCQVCGDSKGGNLTAHHLNSYDTFKEYRTVLWNGLTMCEKCHKEFHGQFGYGSNTEGQFQLFLQTKSMIERRL